MRAGWRNCSRKFSAGQGRGEHPLPHQVSVRGASSRYRVYQYLPYLEAAGIGYRVQPFMAPRAYRAINRSGGTPLKALHTAWAVAHRVATVLGAGGYDLVFLQRECLPSARRGWNACCTGAAFR